MGKKWSEKEDEILRKEYLVTPLHILAGKLGRTENAIRVRYHAISTVDKSDGRGVYRRIVKNQEKAGFM